MTIACNTNASSQAATPHADLMDRVYRLQRHGYDITRKYYLFGRDRLIARMPVGPGDRVLEVGCGTARNLVRLARRHPMASFYGLDASQSMLQTAEAKLARCRLQQRIILRQGLAEELDPGAMFGQNHFDFIFFSYSLSMIPTWQSAIDHALGSLKPGGQLWIVDFWDQAQLPNSFHILLTRWLAAFHVHPRAELIPYLQSICSNLTVESIGKRYAVLARIQQIAAAK